MLRVLTALVLVSACSPSGIAKNGGARLPEAPAPERSSASAAAATPEQAKARRLAPPFGGSSGVRRVTDPGEASPTVVAAIERQN